MKKVLLVFLAAIMLITCTACAKKEEAAKEELYTVNITNNSGVKVLNAGIKNEKNGHISSVGELADGATAKLSMLASKNATTGAPDLAVVYQYENGNYVESVLASGETTVDFIIQPETAAK